MATTKQAKRELTQAEKALAIAETLEHYAAKVLEKGGANAHLEMLILHDRTQVMREHLKKMFAAFQVSQDTESK